MMPRLNVPEGKWVNIPRKKQRLEELLMKRLHAQGLRPMRLKAQGQGRRSEDRSSSSAQCERKSDRSWTCDRG